MHDIDGTKEIRRAVKILIWLVMAGMSFLWAAVMIKAVVFMGYC